MPLVSFPREAENLCFSDLFRGYRKRSVAWNGLILKLPQILRNQLHSPICSQCTLSLPFEITRKPKVFWCFSGSRERVHCEQVISFMLSNPYNLRKYYTKKMKFSIKNFFSKCEQICRKLCICSHLLKRSLMENFILCALKVFTIRFNLLRRRQLKFCCTASR